jgi:hypothetical protein
MIQEYILSFNDEDSLNGEYLGVLEIANTATPAIEIKGIAFSKVSELFFKDDLKYRIAAPILTPSKIYRRDPETGEEYYVIVTEEAVEQAFVKFQKDRAGKDIFNEEHNESKRVPSYPLEMWLVDKPLEDRSYSSFGVEVPKGTWFGVQQFTDKEAYKKAVEEGQTGFSIHGDGALKLSKQVNINSMKVQMKKHKYVAHFTDASETDQGDIIVTADALEEGAEVVVIDDNFEEVADFSGEVTIDDVPVVIENDVIQSIGAAEVEATEVVEEEVVEMAEEVVIEATEEVVEVEAQEEVAADAYTKAEVDAKFDEIYSMIAELKVATPDTESVEMMEEEKDEVSLKMNKINQLTNFITKKK